MTEFEQELIAVMKDLRRELVKIAIELEAIREIPLEIKYLKEESE